MKSKKLKVFIVLILVVLINLTLASFAQMPNNYQRPQQIPNNSQRQFDRGAFESRLNLTQEQKQYINKTRPERIERMQGTVGRMQDVHDRIKDVYRQDIPKYQADIQTMPMKAELAVLKQSAQRQKEQDRRDFENILNAQQRQEFQKIRQEYRGQRPPRY